MVLSDFEKDAIKEVGNVGTGNSATALSKLFNKKIEMIIPETKFINIGGFINEFGNPDDLIVATYLKVLGDLNGESMLIFPHKDAMKIIDLLYKKNPGDTKILDEEAQSAFKEMSNIFTGAYLSSLSDLLSLRLLPSVPYIITDMLGSSLDYVLIKVSTYSDNILTIKTTIKIDDEMIKGDFVIIFDKESYQKIIDQLKKLTNS